ncbi:hypothetical protein FSP39_012145 [Pinctada imbricata]|uniref:Uncharacterized protein n=1 Tax=Pinctada imbricata TaxID=66713 RepID=A0AA88XIR9_PINIB|nr:hypothetical protein FSP39_012145 [Pinctada imbricata]
MLTVTQECMCGMTRRWSSQPFVGSYPAGNLDISAGILYSGSIPSKALRFLEQMNVKAITSRTYFNHQQAILYPSILGVWRVYQSKYFQTIRSNNMPICIGGDGRCDTPGHSAKYCSYTILDVNYMVVADIQRIQV